MIFRRQIQTELARYLGWFDNAGTWSRLRHTGCGGYHRERCESQGGCRRDNLAHSALADQRRQPVTLERHLAHWQTF
jgi:hypothetical protein